MIVDLTSGPEPAAAVVLSTDISDPALRAAASWQVVIPGSAVTGAAATDDVVAVALPEENLVVGLDRRTGTERWRYVIPDEQTNVRLERRGDRIVVRVEVVGRGEVLTELDGAGLPVWNWDTSLTGLPNLSLNRQGLYEANPFAGGRRGQVIIDPDQDQPIIDQWTGVALGNGLELRPAVAEDGAVTLIDVISRARTPTGIVVDPNVESIAYVDGKVVTYDEDRLAVLEIDGTVVWEATFEASATDVEVLPVGIDLPVFALTKLGSGASAVDVRTGAVLWTSTLSSTGIAFYEAEELYAVASDLPDESSGLLEFRTGNLVVTDGVSGGVRPTESGFVFTEPAAPTGTARTIWFRRDGTPTSYVETPANDFVSTWTGDVFLQIAPGSDGSAITAFDINE